MGAQISDDCPVQSDMSPVMVQTGPVLTVTVALQTLLQPPVYVTVTEYVPAVLTVMQFVVAPVLHR